IDRTQMDGFAVQSHQRLAKAIDEAWLNEIEPVYDVAGNVYTEDDGLRRDSSIAKLAKLKPVFDRPFGKVTAGNSAQVTDGAAMLILASESAVKKHNLPVLGRISEARWSALEPEQMGLGPAHAMFDLLKNHQLSLKDIDYWEINEAFATQVLGCIEAWKDTDYCRQKLGLQEPMGEIDSDKLNVDGGGISIGHPVGASGARIVLHLLHLLERKKAHRGIASLCIGGGQGGAMLVERGE
ncbi:MAG: acetyl-CoA C-acyltransferase, partial [Gammaproteobacteria bacterium]|nr:acetyl-CoA C-acyltransferase [Gammaproteobacteria bacterium]